MPRQARDIWARAYQGPAATLVDNVIQATGTTLNEKQRAAVIDIIEEELKKKTSSIIKAVVEG